MPRSHICPSCLTELARIRAVPDPHYGLGVVVCPGCSLASVRTGHLDQQFWRAVRGTWVTIRLVIAKVMLTFLLSGLLTGLVFWSSDLFTDYRGNIHFIDPFVSGYFETTLGAWGVPIAAVAIGCFIRLVYLHLKAWVPISMVLVLAVAYMALDYTGRHLFNAMDGTGSFRSQIDIPSASTMILRGQFFAMIAGLAFVGLIPAALLHRSVERGRTRRFRKIRKKLRKRRSHDS